MCQGAKKIFLFVLTRAGGNFVQGLAREEGGMMGNMRHAVKVNSFYH